MRNLIFKILSHSGLPFFFREIKQRNRVTILLFHDIRPETADKTFDFLTKKYNVIHLNDFIEAIEKKAPTKIPQKALIITFDDGHKGNYNLLPIIKKYDIPIWKGSSHRLLKKQVCNIKCVNGYRQVQIQPMEEKTYDHRQKTT